LWVGTPGHFSWREEAGAKLIGEALLRKTTYSLKVSIHAGFDGGIGHIIDYVQCKAINRALAENFGFEDFSHRTGRNWQL
jgi:hypothetical protein